MVGPLQRVMVCSPSTAGWNQPERAARWQQLGFLHAPDFVVAQAQHDALRLELAATGVEIIEFFDRVLPDARACVLTPKARSYDPAKDTRLYDALA